MRSCLQAHFDHDLNLTNDPVKVEVFRHPHLLRGSYLKIGPRPGFWSPDTLKLPVTVTEFHLRKKKKKVPSWWLYNQDFQRFVPGFAELAKGIGVKLLFKINK